MKAILVIDVPNEMYDKLHSADVILTLKDWGGTYVYPTVDVKPLPQRQNTDEKKSSLEYVYEADTLDEFQTRGASYLYGHIDGWNDCLKEIEK